MTAYDRYRPTAEVTEGNIRPALDCMDCHDWEGWPGVRVWTAPENAAVDLADQVRAADEHERICHPTGCRCEPYDCNHGDEGDDAPARESGRASVDLNVTAAAMGVPSWMLAGEGGN